MARVTQVMGVASVPYLVTVLFAAVGWSVTHSVDRILASPTVEFRKAVQTTGGKRTTSISIENLSRQQTFKDLQFALLLPDKPGNEFVSAKIEVKEPTWEGDISPKTEGRSAIFDIPALHPGWRLTLVAYSLGPSSPELRLMSASTPLRLVERSIETTFVRYEFWILIGMSIIWLVLIFSILSTQTARMGSST